MNIEKIVKDLRSKGYRVHIAHFRYTPTQQSLWTTVELRETNRPPSLKGGMTHVKIVGDDFTINKYAECSLKDSFCKKLGTTIALGRALKALKTEV